MGMGPISAEFVTSAHRVDIPGSYLRPSAFSVSPWCSSGGLVSSSKMVPTYRSVLAGNSGAEPFSVWLRFKRQHLFGGGCAAGCMANVQYDHRLLAPRETALDSSAAAHREVDALRRIAFASRPPPGNARDFGPDC